MTRQIWPLVILLIMGTIWGLQFAMLKLAVESGYRELNVLMLALALISLIYGVLVAIRRRFFWLTYERLKFFVVIAVIGYILPMGATLFAAPYVPAGILTLMASLAPMFTFAAALTLRTEPVSKVRIWAVLLGCVSTTLVLAPEAQLPGHGALPWMVVALLIPFCYGVESVYVAARWPQGLDVMQVGFGEALAAAILAVPLLFLFGEPENVTIQGSTAELAILVFVLCGVFEVFMYFHLVRTTGGVLVSFGTFISLFAGIAWGMVIFSESHDSMVWLAVIVLVAALALVSIDKIKQRGSEA